MGSKKSGLSAAKIRNSLKKGRLWIIYNNKEFEVIELFSKRVSIKNLEGSMYNASVQELEFKAFKANT